jgi:Zn-dependent peptidase ImmA (M78 family)/transcriptional regulator with XRE-family HTH domain
VRDKLPINVEVLKWARTSLSLQPGDVAQRLGASFKAETLLAWESGQASPTYAQLERLAHEIYKRPVAVFFFPSVPEEETPRTEFRTLPGAVIDKLPPEIIKLYRKAKLFQLNLEELYEGRPPVKTSLLENLALDDTSSSAETAQALRGVLGVSIKEQSKWRSTETAMKKWREALEAQGIFVFKDAFRNDDYSGFCLYDWKYPVIFVNSSLPDSRQVFTLFHELGHLLYHSGGIDFRSRQAVRSFRGYHRDVEAGCNQFASDLLVPPGALANFRLQVSDDKIQEIAQHFSVSREVILRKYLERGVVDASYYEKMAAKWAEQAKRRRSEGAGGGNYYYNQKAYLGEKYISLVYEKYYQGRITADTVADYLNVKARNLPTFEHVVLEGGRV